MLNCKISKGVEGACAPVISGVLRLAIANYGEDYTFTSSQGCDIDTIDLGGEKVYAFDVADNTGQMKATLTQGNTPSYKYFNHQVNGTIVKLDCDLLGEYANLSFGKFIIFVETKNHDVYALGVDNGVSATTFEYDSGAGEGDASGIAFQYEGAQPNPPLKIKDWNVVKGLMA